MPKIGQVVGSFSPYWQTTDGRTVRLYKGDSIAVLKRLPSKSVQCVVTSPPYWGLRSYLDADHPDKTHELGAEPSPDCGTRGQAQCGRCFVCSLVAVFREVRRVLRDDGVCWLNLGDSYSTSPRGNKEPGGGNLTNSNIDGKGYEQQRFDGGKAMDKLKATGLLFGNLVGVPWRVALSLQEDGWVLRQDVIWHKPSPMPESVRNRCTKSHEYVFLLAKKQGYFYDAEAIKDVSRPEHSVVRIATPKNLNGLGLKPTKEYDAPTNGTANKRSVWTVDDGAALRDWLAFHDPGLLEAFLREEKMRSDVWKVSSGGGYRGAHFATFPPDLIRPMILAGTSAKGACADCGAPWKRSVRSESVATRSGNNTHYGSVSEDVRGDQARFRRVAVTETTGWEPTCECGGEVVPCVVLDPFAGAATTAVVSIELGRNSVGIELSEKYLTRNAIPRVVGELLSRPNLARLVPRSVTKMRGA